MINVDLPWNPAVLEQRDRPRPPHGPEAAGAGVRAGDRGDASRRTCCRRWPPRRTWRWRRSMPSRDVEQVDLASGMEELKGRLEVLLGAKPEGAARRNGARPPARRARGTRGETHRERVAAAGGELLGAAFKFLGELVSQQQAAPPPETLVANLRGSLDACVEDDGDGKPRLTVTLPDRAALDNLAQTLAKLLAVAEAGKGHAAESR